MNIPASSTLIFDIGNENKWERAIDSYATSYVNDLLEFKPHERTSKI